MTHPEWQTPLFSGKTNCFITGIGWVDGYSVHHAPQGSLTEAGFVWPQSTRRWQAMAPGDQHPQRGFTTRQDAAYWLIRREA